MLHSNNPYNNDSEPQESFGNDNSNFLNYSPTTSNTTLYPSITPLNLNQQNDSNNIFESSTYTRSTDESSSIQSLSTSPSLSLSMAGESKEPQESNYLSSQFAEKESMLQEPTPTKQTRKRGKTSSEKGTTDSEKNPIETKKSKRAKNSTSSINSALQFASDKLERNRLSAIRYRTKRQSQINEFGNRISMLEQTVAEQKNEIMDLKLQLETYRMQETNQTQPVFNPFPYGENDLLRLSSNNNFNSPKLNANNQLNEEDLANLDLDMDNNESTTMNSYR